MRYTNINMLSLSKQKPKTPSKFKQWFNAHPKIYVAITIAIFLIAIAIITLGFILLPSKNDATITSKPTVVARAAAPETPKFYSPLTGVPVTDQAATRRQVTAVMIENSPSARPQSGIKDAGVVFEAIAEGGITRFLTLHQEDRPGLIGPVRSLRPYYVSWLAAFDASVAHVGGSKSALDEIRNGTYKDIDQFFNGNSYWRATDRYAPHNVYTNFDRLDALNQKKGFTSSTFTGFPRKTDSKLSQPTAKSIDMPVSSGDYTVHYDYDQVSNSYLRSEGGAAHNDREGGRITPHVVIAIKVPMQLGFEDGYREQMNTIGSGEAYIFQDGGVIQGFWHKTAKKDQMQFYDKNSQIIMLNPGQTWISVHNTDKNITWQ